MEFYAAGDYASAIPGLEKAADLDPSSPEYSFYLGACYLLTDRVSEGIASLGDTIDLGETPFLEEALFLSAKAHLLANDQTAARRELQRVISLEGEQSDAARNLLELAFPVPEGVPP
jgi:tetratricopeptide (TPR) repeat protein